MTIAAKSRKGNLALVLTSVKPSLVARLYDLTPREFDTICRDLNLSSIYSLSDYIEILDRAGLRRSKSYILYHELSDHYPYRLRNDNIYNYSANIEYVRRALGPSAFSVAESSGQIVQVKIGGEEMRWMLDGSRLYFVRQDDAALIRLMLDLPVQVEA